MPSCAAASFPVIGRLRPSRQWSPERILTLIVDRSIYSNDIFNRFLADPAIHFITWEKGYQSETDTPWETLLAQHRAAGTYGSYGSHTFSRLRNNDNPADSQIPPPLKKPQSRGTQLARPFVKSEVVE